MTFYWWSHWFWVTAVLLALLLLPNLVREVHTYPSQEINFDNRNQQQTKHTQQQDQEKKSLTTKLYQSTASIAWTTTVLPPAQSTGNSENIMSLLVKPFVDKEEGAEKSLFAEVDDLLQYEGAVVTNAAADNDENYSNSSYNSDDVATLADDDDSVGNEYKRSADFYNKTHDNNAGTSSSSSSIGSVATASLDRQQTSTTAENDEISTVRHIAELNNYTNFSNINTLLSTNSTTINHQNENSSLEFNTSKATPDISKTAPAAATPSTPRIIVSGSVAGATEWLNTLLPSGTATRPSAFLATTDDINVDGVDNTGVHNNNSNNKVAPFTLENVNKEDELRRAENEHRSRKSKELSAEYKHINRYINFSSDSKSLLTRSASTAPHEFDADESNISSEALAIQRTYFLDAGAISAICFTVFGVCCTVGTIGIVLYRRRYLNKPQALSEPDSSVYIDDSTMRDNSDEMYSLDNDSFLNSLEAMTIQNYWTDTVKHTKL